MVDWKDLPIVRGLLLPHCRSIAWRSWPFALIYSSPFVLLFCYYNTHNMLPMKLWNVKLIGRDLLIGWTIATVYVMMRALLVDPYCDPHSFHYSKEVNAFERKKRVMDAMKGILESEGRDMGRDKDK